MYILIFLYKYKNTYYLYISNTMPSFKKIITAPLKLVKGLIKVILFLSVVLLKMVVVSILLIPALIFDFGNNSNDCIDFVNSVDDKFDDLTHAIVEL